jgi:hypothetical protein
MQGRINQLIELDETRRHAYDHLFQSQEKTKKKFDKRDCQRNLQEGDLVLLWNKKGEKPGNHGKFESLWLGPYQIQGVAGNNSFYLSHLDGEKLPLPINRNFLSLLLM